LSFHQDYFWKYEKYRDEARDYGGYGGAGRSTPISAILYLSLYKKCLEISSKIEQILD